MDIIQGEQRLDASALFDSRFISSKPLYLHRFRKVPNVHFINHLNGEKASAAFRERFAALIEADYFFRWYDRKRRKYEFTEALFIMKNNCLVEFGSYCEILHDGSDPSFLEACTELMRGFGEQKKRVPLEINLIVREGSTLHLKSMEVKRTRLDLDLFYEEEFLAVDAVIQQRLRRRNDKGIVLLHGLPGTGKTTYLRYLVGRIRKRVLFLSPSVAGDLMNPEFIDLLIDNPNTVVIIEDAENIIMDRRANGSSAVSNLLNISDGLLADFLNVQLICTFNSALTSVDPALMRKGRLIARYEFGRLGLAKAQRLSDHLGFDRIIDRPMTLAEISGQNEPGFEANNVEVIGFRRQMESVN